VNSVLPEADLAWVRRLSSLALKALVVLVAGSFVLTVLILANVLPAAALDILPWLGIASALYWLVLIRSIGRVIARFDPRTGRLATSIGLLGIVVGVASYALRFVEFDAAAGWAVSAGGLAVASWHLLLARLVRRADVQPANLWLRSAVAGVASLVTTLAGPSIATSLSIPISLLGLSVIWFLFGLARLDVASRLPRSDGGAVTAVETINLKAAGRGG
jgi:hypothetical protein